LAAQVPPSKRSLSSRHQIPRLSGNKPLDILNDLIGERLHGFIAGPGNMRRENKVRQI
jgi:hypothetical protein